MKYNRIILIAGCLAILLAGCGGGSSGNEAAAGRMVTGTLFAPDQVTPVAAATVYIPAAQGEVAAGIIGNTSTNCAIPDVPYDSYSCTSANGDFTLEIPQAASTASLFFRKGFFNTQITVDMTSGKATGLNIALPADPARGAGRFAVIQGSYDRMEDILAKLGMGEVDQLTNNLVPGTETFALYPEMLPLFIDQDGDSVVDIFDFDVVFINCGQYPENDILLNHQQLLQDYVRQGGVLYVTDQAYDFVEQLFPEYLDFYGDDGLPETTAEALDLAQLGLGDIIVDATVLDPVLRDWLSVVDCDGGDCLNPDSTVSIQGFLPDWAVFHGAHPGHADKVKLWTEGDISIYDMMSGKVLGPLRKPLTASINIGQGKIIYSSYHTDEISPSAGFRPQERILQYLVFEL